MPAAWESAPIAEDNEERWKSAPTVTAEITGTGRVFGRNMNGSVDQTDVGQMSTYNAHHGAYNDTDLRDPALVGMAIGQKQAMELTGLQNGKAAQESLLGRVVHVTNDETGQSAPVQIVDKAPANQPHVEMTPAAHRAVGSNGSHRLRVSLDSPPANAWTSAPLAEPAAVPTPNSASDSSELALRAESARPEEIAADGQQAIEQNAATGGAPAILKNAVGGAVDAVSGMLPHLPRSWAEVPQTAKEVAQFLTPLAGVPDEFDKAHRAITGLTEGKSVNDVAREVYPEAFLLADAEGTPPWSRERFAAGLSTVGQVAMMAGVAREIKARSLAEPAVAVEAINSRRAEATARPAVDYEAERAAAAERTAQIEAAREEVRNQQPVIQSEATGARGQSPEEVAAEREYQQQLLEEAKGAMGQDTLELKDAIIEAGGLPSQKSPYRSDYAGEIGRVEDAVRNPQRGEKLPANDLFREDAPHPDELATRLRERGFEFNTPGELLDAAEQRFRTGKEHYGISAPVSEEQVALATPKREQLTLKSLADIPESTKPATPQLRIAPGEYRGQAGFSVRGRDARGKQIKVFAPTRESAERIRTKLATNQQLTLDDFQLRNRAGERVVTPEKLRAFRREQERISGSSGPTADQVIRRARENLAKPASEGGYGSSSSNAMASGEKIVAAAVRDRGGLIHRGTTHGEALAAAGGDVSRIVDDGGGYVTNKGRYLTEVRDGDLLTFIRSQGAPLAAPAQTTLPRLIQSTPAAPLPPGATFRSLADIRKDLARQLDIPVRLGTRIPGGLRGGALGYYRVKPQTIRLKALNDIPTLAHEIGHDLHHIVFDNPVTGKPQRWAHAYDNELFPLGQRTSLPHYSNDQVRMEGVAEFAREWLTDRAQAAAHAPTFAAHFESTLRTEHPEIHAILEQARKDIAGYIAAPGWEKAKSMIRWKEPKTTAPVREQLERFYTHWFDELRPIQRMMGKLVDLGLDPQTAGEVSARAVNYKGGWRGKADHDLRFEQTDLNGTRRGKGLHEIMAGVDDLQEWDTYLALKRAQEKQSQGFKSGFEDALADPDTHAKLRQLAPAYEARRQELIKFSDGLMANMEQSGFFTAEQLNAMRTANRDYVPFHRIYEGVTGESIGPKGGGTGFVNTSSGVMKFKGSDLQIASPTEAVIKNTYLFRDLAERNRVARTFVDAVEQTTGGGRVAESILKPMKPTNVSHAEMVAKLNSLQLGPLMPFKIGETLDKAGVDLAHTIFRAADGVSAKDGTFRVWKDGKEKLYQVGDPDLLRSITLADSDDASLIRKMPGFKPAAWITAKLRTGATLSLEFIARNPIRDQFTAAVFSRNGFVPFYDAGRAMFSVLKKDHWYRDWIKSGASNSGIYEGGPRSVEEALRDIAPGDRSLAASLFDRVNVLRGLQKASALMEEGTRVAEFRRAIENGKSPMDAANDAKDVTLNFSRYGVKGKVINQISAFFNASLQDVDKLIRAHQEAPMRTATKAFMYITTPSLLTWWLGKDDPKIQSLPEWRKSYFWNVNLGDYILSVPKPFLLGAIYGTGAEKALDYLTNRDPNAVRKWGASLVQNTFIRSDLIVATNALKPIVENIANYSFFQGRPLVNESQQQLAPSLQFNPQTSETAKFIGKAINYSPIMIDNLVRGYTGGLGVTATEGVDWFLVKSGMAVNPAPGPAKSWRELPGIRGFFQSPYAANEYPGRFYKAMDIAERRLQSFDKYGSLLNTGEQRKFWNDNRNEIVWYSAGTGDKSTVITELRRARDQMSDIGKAMVTVQNERGLDPQTKRERLIQLKDMRDKLAEQAFRTYVHPTDRFKVY